MRKFRIGWIIWTIVLYGASFGVAGPGESQVWLGPDGSPLPYKTRDQIEDALRTADVISMELINIGIAGARKVILEKDGERLHAVFRDVSVYKPKWTDNKVVRIGFRDNFLFECAAYELSKLLGMDNIPPVVPRRIDGTDGSLQIWVENAMMEGERVKRKIEPPDSRRWHQQLATMRLFDNLIYNDDRNLGNTLIDENWKIWLIDHTRSFRPIPNLPASKLVRHCDRAIWEILNSLDDTLIESRLKDLVWTGELNALIKRKQKLVDHLQQKIDQMGEKAVIVTFQRD